MNARQTLAIALLSIGFVCMAPLTQARQGAPGGIFPPPPAALPPPVPTQFDITGFIQEASLDVGNSNSTCKSTPADRRLDGGTVKLNGITVVVPCNTILQMPATSLTWADLFQSAPTGTPLGQTGLALTENPLPSHEIHILGNIVNGKYIAGLLFVSQQSLNVGQGYMKSINYATGELLIGNSTGQPDVRVRLNDPVGRFGLKHGDTNSGADVTEPGFDPRFTADTDNPTVHADTGYPLCIPRFNPFDPTGGDDPLCPQANRPRAPACKSLPAPFPPFTQPASGQFCGKFMMDAPGATGCTPGPCTDPTQQAPVEIGDFVDYQGTLKLDANGQAFLSAHTLIAHLGIYTRPGFPPAYVSIEALLAGTNALPIANLPQEATSRIKVEGFSTDPNALVDIYAMDIDPITGVTTNRLLGTESAKGPPVVGRFRFIPAAGAFAPLTRNIRVVSRTMCQSFGNIEACLAGAPSVANGLQAGQYNAPNFEFIFAENTTLGDPIVPANFQDLLFLACGSGPLNGTGAVVGPLDPGPWGQPMPMPTCPTSSSGGGSGSGGSTGNPPPVADQIQVATASWDNRKNRGRLNVTATSSIPAGTSGLQLYIQASNGAAKLSSQPIAMSVVSNLAGQPPVCPAGTTKCWQYTASGALTDPNGGTQFLQPLEITVTSSMGGKITTNNILVR